MATLSYRLPWYPPVPERQFVVNRRWLFRDAVDYPQTKVHPGVDYPAMGSMGVPVFACAAGEIVYTGTEASTLGMWLGNHVVLYVPHVNRSFLYAHLATPSPLSFVCVVGGAPLGVMGETGKADGVHLHLEGFYGRFTTPKASRVLLIEADVQRLTFDPDQYIRARLRDCVQSA